MGNAVVFHLGPPCAVVPEVPDQKCDGPVRGRSLIRNSTLDQIDPAVEDHPVLKTIERRGRVSACPSITPPSGCCIRVSHAPINRTCSIRSGNSRSVRRIGAASHRRSRSSRGTPAASRAAARTPLMSRDDR